MASVMLETPLLPPDRDGNGADHALRMPMWPELTARLAAAHDLRRLLGKVQGRTAGSFAQFVAADGQPINDRTHSVNPTALADGKDDRRTIAASEVDGPVSGHSNGFTRADREMR